MCGIFGAYAAIFPHKRLTLLLFFIIPVSVKARTLAIVLGLINLVSMLSQPDGIAYSAHLAGGIAGYLYALHLINPGFKLTGLHIRKFYNDQKWKWQRRKFTVIKNDQQHYTNDFSTQPPDPQEIERILEKISKWGFQSLTDADREILNRASRYRQNER